MDILEIFEKQIPKVAKSMAAFPWEHQGAYLQFLAQTYYYVRHSTPLLGRALRKMESTTGHLKGRFLEHTKEEKGHQYLVLEDLAAFGRQIDEFPEHAETVNFYKTQYDLIDQEGPSSLFGYILQLEGTAWKCGNEVLERVARTHGADKIHFVKVHSGDEIVHVERAAEMVRTLPADVIKLVENNLVMSCDLYCKMIERAAKEKNRSLLALSKKAA